MIGSRAWRALMRRNAIYRKRNWIGAALELILPVFFVGILVLIKGAVEDSDGFKPETVAAKFPADDEMTHTTFSFTDYVTAIQADRFCEEVPAPEMSKYRYEPVNGKFYGISGIAEQGYNWQVPFVRCDSRKCKKHGQDASKFCEYMGLGLAPSSDTDAKGNVQAAAFGDYIMERYPQLNSTPKLDFDFLQKFTSDDEMNDYVEAGGYRGGENGPKIALAIVFDGTDDSINYNYRLRVNSTNFNSPEDERAPVSTTPPTDQNLVSFAKEDSDSCPSDDDVPGLGPYENSCTGKYVYNGALTLQRLVGDWIFVETGAKAAGYYVAEHGVQYSPFPSREYVESGFYESIGPFAPLLITLGLLYPVAAMIRAIALEKQLRQKELMKMMSVTEADIGWSWFLSFSAFHLVTATLTALLTTQFYVNSGGFFLWIFWLFTFLSIITFSMFVATFFTIATRATLVGLMVFFVGYFLTLIVDYQTSSLGTITLISLHPVGALSFGLQEIGRLEDLGIGLTADTFSETDSPSGYTLSSTFSSFIFDSILWGVLTWYVNRVIKNDLGRPLRWYFPFTRSYWLPSSVKPPVMEGNEDVAYNDGIAVEEPSNALKDQAGRGMGIQIRGLHKTFGDKTAVDGLSMDIYTNQITALLGHNGAGKTTTISMLTGMLEPSSGYAKVAGKDIRSNMTAIRQDIGICLQHDCLFPDLTVKEHVQFFARIKGLYEKLPYEEAEQKVETSIQDVALAEKRDTRSKNLSGGMKRKLSVAIAFCGDSKTVLLDEPTSGMDPFSRRFTWNVIRQYRQDRCIILTTHFMDEADILGDRIAIMSEGQLRCLGSSLYLKKTYGVGYQLTIEKRSSDHADHDEKLENIVTEAVPEATLLSNVGTELSFQLPLGASSKFTPMFEHLDQEIDQKGIVTYGVGITTLDEVFLLVARSQTAEKEALQSSRTLGNQIRGANIDADKSVRSRMDLEDEGLFVRHVGALFRKRAVNFKRDKKAWCCTTILPTLFVFIGFILAKYVTLAGTLEPITLDLDAYNNNIDGTADQPQNPVAFNSDALTYTCQPGKCIYDFPVVEELSGKLYSLCGTQSDLGGNESCSILDSKKLVDGISVNGATAFEIFTEDVSNTSYTLANTALDFKATQYGGIFYSHVSGSLIEENGLNYSKVVSATCAENLAGPNQSNFGNLGECENYGGIGYVLRYNFTAIHATPLYQTLADEAILKAALGDEDFTIKTTIHPLPLTKVESNYGNSQDAFSAWFLITLSFPFIAGSFATFVVTERLSKAKHLQTVAGVKPYSYWLSTWLWDVVNYQISCWCTIVLMFAFNVEVLTTEERGVVWGVILVICLYGPAAASFSYCASYMFTSPSTANMVLIISGFLIGLGGSLTVFVLRLIGANEGDPNQSLITAADIVAWILRFHPSFCLSNGLQNAIYIETLEYFEGEEVTVWSSSILRNEVIFLTWESVVYLYLAMKIDGWSSNPRAVSIWHQFVRIITCQFCCPGGGGGDYEEVGAATPDDDDVIAEQERVGSGGANDDLIVLSQLSKVYDTGKVAVNKISFGIPPGQCFGLLGINGAGKTTTMGMLTAEFPPTSGDATLAGFSVSREPEKTRRRVGYCPQFDAHFENLTGREHVELYASIKGVPMALIKEAGAMKLAEVGLSDKDSDRLSSGYSGGMKRRLSLACATIGQPQIVFLDECSTGVDPVARREIWQMISDMVTGSNVPQEEKTSVILTTHSMEECEALCPNIAIMAGGKLRCLGSAQQLKTKFGQGFQVEMKIKNVEPNDTDYLDNVRQLAQAAELTLPEIPDEEGVTSTHDDIFFSFTQVWNALQVVAGDDYLVGMVTEKDPVGYLIFKEANSVTGIDLDGLAVFVTSELRMRKLHEYVTGTYANSVLRERQDTKARYEVASDGIRISSIFGSIEENKSDLLVAEYGVSQTSLEQVFNMHAAEAEKLKHGTNDR